MHSVTANGAEIPAIGFGTWTLKGETCAALVAHALSVGYRHLDTAEYYENEAAVGEGLRFSGVSRDSVFITTKVRTINTAPGDLERSAERSLRDLGLDAIDLLLLHWPNPAVPLAGTMKALNAVRKSGITRHIGVSNFPTSMLAEAVRLSDAALICNQVEYHPYLDQTRVRKACMASGMAMVAYCPLGRGGALFGERVIEDAARHHGKSPAQIVLRWHVQQEGVVAIPRAEREEWLVENLDPT
ncbi:aldo/keto reductase [Mesorhizobium sp. PL10]